MAYLFIAVSIWLSPWFSWYNNALSDLGRSTVSPVAPLFNFGLLFAGAIILLYAVLIFWNHARYTSICLVISAFLLQIVAAFNENYGFLHFIVSVFFFFSIGISSVVYTFERKSIVSFAAFLIGLASWILHYSRVYTVGIAVPETISAVVVTFWIVRTSIRIYTRE